MTSLSDRIKRAAELCDRDADHAAYNEYPPDRNQGLEDVAHYDGQQHENTRLSPLITALSEVVSNVQEHLKHSDCECGSEGCEVCYLHQALSSLNTALKQMEGDGGM